MMKTAPSSAQFAQSNCFTRLIEPANAGQLGASENIARSLHKAEKVDWEFKISSINPSKFTFLGLNLCPYSVFLRVLQS